MNRGELHELFVQRFHFGNPPLPCTEVDLNVFEDMLGTTLPSSYREFMRWHGRVYTPDILDEIVERGFEHPDLQDILSPSEAIQNTKAYWSGGMPENLVGVASDCMGNMIGFQRELKLGERPADVPVWFFDHDLNKVHAVASSFDEFISWFVKHLEGHSRKRRST